MLDFSISGVPISSPILGLEFSGSGVGSDFFFLNLIHSSFVLFKIPFLNVAMATDHVKGIILDIKYDNYGISWYRVKIFSKSNF